MNPTLRLEFTLQFGQRRNYMPPLRVCKGFNCSHCKLAVPGLDQWLINAPLASITQQLGNRICEDNEVFTLEPKAATISPFFVALWRALSNE